ncbi:MAG: hypothetical protein DRP80_01135 [Candidatus Omnitrophota bacterium]|mgnify:CR=1 FL=1|nr:MAG: hypothetical protein DRP69_03250 [Candidatus Omnitrophota bacterium]RKY44800.1 MAG: hypothetical protein DRP80_01135 [Candidatus Omnitrophota bacterium]
MRIGCLGFELPQGKVKYKDSRLLKLEEKTSPKKTHHFFAEFTQDIESAVAVVSSKEKSIDLFISDLEIVEKRLTKVDSRKEALLNKCNQFLEKETPLSEVEFSPEELILLKDFPFLTLKPLLILEKLPSDINQLISQVLEKANLIFFYTLVKSELKSWLIKRGSSVGEAAGKIHSDLAKGFIKAEVINFQDFINVHNFSEARSKGLVKVVGRDYLVQDGDIIEIKFSV